MRFTGIGAIDLAVDRHPLVQSLGVEHHVIDGVGRSRDVDLCADFTHPPLLHITQRPFDGGFEAVQAHAERGRRIAVARQQVVFERLHQRFDQPGSSSATAAATTDATGVRLNGSESAGRSIIITAPMRWSICS